MESATPQDFPPARRVGQKSRHWRPCGPGPSFVGGTRTVSSSTWPLSSSWPSVTPWKTADWASRHSHQHFRRRHRRVPDCGQHAQHPHVPEIPPARPAHVRHLLGTAVGDAPRQCDLTRASRRSSASESIFDQGHPMHLISTFSADIFAVAFLMVGTPNAPGLAAVGAVAET